MSWRAIATIACLALLPSTTRASPPSETRPQCADFDPLRRPYFGDLHVHTVYSLDASTQGTRTTPAQAYELARGAELGIQPWSADGTPLRRVRLQRPLDFAAVTDHSEYFGETSLCRVPDMPGYDSLMCRVYRTWPRLAFFLMNGRTTPFGICGPGMEHCRTADALPWQDMRDAAEAAYDRSEACRFTTFVGYEWTGYTHRNVIFRSAAVPAFAPSALEYSRETELWDVLEKLCRAEQPGCDFVVIPHNSNLSAATTFQTQRPDGPVMTAVEARRRAANEPLVEIMQHKGSSECFAGAGTEDELCDFENVPYDDIGARFITWMRREPAAINFARTGLGIGLLELERTGANPFQFGFIGSTDTHLGAPGLADEENYPGHGGAGVPMRRELPDMLLDPIEYNPGGLAVLWAEENSRDALFAAMQRRETYATSGPRIILRMFAGWDLPTDLCERSDFAAVGYQQGVPMGGELRSGGAAPLIAVRAMKDAGTSDKPGLPLQRLQIIKLWVKDGVVQESVVDVAAAADRSASVDTSTCTPAPTGDDELCAVWRDPDFNTAAPAVYYARAVQDPTCRWSTMACNRAGVRCAEPATVRRGWQDCCDPTFPKVVQERAWSSPIWYSPGG